MFWPIPSLIIVAVLVGWALLLWRLARSSKPNKVYFYIILALPFLISILFSFILRNELLMQGVSLGTMAAGLLLSLLLLGTYFYLWGEALWDAAGEQQVGWFILMAIPPLSWLFIIYRVTEE